MNKIIIFSLVTIVAFVIVAISEPRERESNVSKNHRMKIVHLSEGDTAGFYDMRNSFIKNNPGYDLSYSKNIRRIQGNGKSLVIFVQAGEGIATLNGQDTSSYTVGDIIQIEGEDVVETDEGLDVLVFEVPESLPENIPTFVRPDWDPNITDVPGGCATETNAYRRILLTWLDKVGPYQYHALNAHRVRIMDSFTHYHPKEGGFDEFYLVQMALPEARLYTSEEVSFIESPETIKRKQADHLIKKTELNVGDLVYLPRGVAHRGYGGVLAQVITVPGFVPGSEIGIDHHIRAINNNLSLSGSYALPYNEQASTGAVVK